MITVKRIQYIKKTLFVLEDHAEEVLVSVKRKVSKANISPSLFTMRTRPGYFVQFLLDYINTPESDEFFKDKLKRIAVEHVESCVDVSHYGFFCGYLVEAMSEYAEQYYDIDLSEFKTAWTMLYVTLANQIILLSQEAVPPKVVQA